MVVTIILALLGGLAGVLLGAVSYWVGRDVGLAVAIFGSILFAIALIAVFA